MVIAISAVSVFSYNIDQAAFLKINGCRNRFLDVIAPPISASFTVPALMYVYSAGYGLYRDDDGAFDFAVIGVVSAGTTVFANQLIKHFVKRERPIFSLPEAQGDYTHGLSVKIFPSEEYSFPSQSASLSMSMAVVYGMAYPKYDIYFYTLALLNGWSRIYRGAHYPLDVIGGEALGALITHGVVAIMRSLDGRYNLRHESVRVPIARFSHSF